MNNSLSFPDSVSDPQPAQASIGKRLLLWAFLLLLAVVVLAETGVLSAESTDQKWSTESQYDTSWSGRRGVLRIFRFVPNVEVAAGSGSGAAVAKAAAETIRKSAAGPGTPGGKLQITISNVTMERSPWLPFFKNGSCRFTANYTLEAAAGGSQIQVKGTIHGKVEQSTRGLCSLNGFRQIMGKTVATAIYNEIQKMIVKNS